MAYLPREEISRLYLNSMDTRALEERVWCAARDIPMITVNQDTGEQYTWMEDTALVSAEQNFARMFD